MLEGFDRGFNCSHRSPNLSPDSSASILLSSAPKRTFAWSAKVTAFGANPFVCALSAFTLCISLSSQERLVAPGPQPLGPLGFGVFLPTIHELQLGLSFSYKPWPLWVPGSFGDVSVSLSGPLWPWPCCFWICGGCQARPAACRLQAQLFLTLLALALALALQGQISLKGWL